MTDANKARALEIRTLNKLIGQMQDQIDRLVEDMRQDSARFSQSPAATRFHDTFLQQSPGAGRRVAPTGRNSPTRRPTASAADDKDPLFRTLFPHAK